MKSRLIVSTVICQSCGVSNDAGAVFCTECGVTLEISSQQPLVNKVDPFQELPGPRSFIGWGIYTVVILVISFFASLFLGFFFFTSSVVLIIFNMLLRIPYAVYINQNFTDHKKLLNTTHGYQIQIPNPQLMVVFYILLPIIPIFIKYREFRGHLLREHQDEVVLPYSPYTVTGIIYGLPFLFNNLLSRFIQNSLDIELSFFILFSLISPIIILIYRIMAEYKWQKSMNTHIHNHIGFLSK